MTAAKTVVDAHAQVEEFVIENLRHYYSARDCKTAIRTWENIFKKIQDVTPDVDLKTSPGEQIQRAVVNFIIKNPRHWKQEEWYCKSAFCMAGFGMLVGLNTKEKNPNFQYPAYFSAAEYNLDDDSADWLFNGNRAFYEIYHFTKQRLLTPGFRMPDEDAGSILDSDLNEVIHSYFTVRVPRKQRPAFYEMAERILADPIRLKARDEDPKPSRYPLLTADGSAIQ